MIRDGTASESVEIRAVVRAAFGGDSEAGLIKDLQQDGDVVISLVAVEGDVISGHILLSCMRAPVRALGLAPLSVLPGFQNRGTGSALVRHSLDIARRQGWEAVFVLGDPGFYARFGFRARLAQPFSSPYAGSYFMALELQNEVLQGREGAVDYAPAFARL